MTDGVIDYGSGNVFADLGFPQPEEHLAKAELTQQILKIIKQRGMNQTAAAELLGIDQPKVSAIVLVQPESENRHVRVSDKE